MKVAGKAPEAVADKAARAAENALAEIAAKAPAADRAGRTDALVKIAETALGKIGGKAVLETVQKAGKKKGGAAADDATAVRAARTTHAALMTALAEAPPLRSRVSSAADPRGPPADRGDYRYSVGGFGEWQEYDDSPERTERVLEGRIEVDQSKAALAAEKKKVASGEVTKAAYAKDEKKHQQLAKQVAADRAELSPERAELVDEVVDGHRELTAQEKRLAAEEKKVAAGTVTKKAHAQNVAKFEAQRDEVYEATDELMAATDNEVSDAVPSRSRGEGSAAGCGSSGAFVACGSVSRGADGEKDTDRCVALAGVSSGCGVQTSSGESKGSASCTLSAADQGCGSSVSHRNADGEVATASASCTGRCDVTGYAYSSGAQTQCRTDGGVCDSSSTGSRPDRDEARQAATGRGAAAIRAAGTEPVATGGESRSQGSGSAHCESAGGCGTSSTVDLGDGADLGDRGARAGRDAVMAGAEVSCDAACTGRSTSSTDTGRKAAPRDASATAGAAGDQALTGTPEAATNASAACAATGGACRTHSESRAAGAADVGGSSAATADVDCDGAAGCTGTGASRTGGTASGLREGAARTSTGSATCDVSGGACGANSSTEVDSPVEEREVRWVGSDDDGAVQPAVLTDGVATASSSSGTRVDCGDSTACSGKGTTATTGRVTGTVATAGGAAPVRATKGSSNCEASAGVCSAESASDVSDGAAPVSSRTGLGTAGAVQQAARELSASSRAGAQVECAGADCGGSAASTTSGSASGDVTGVRDSTGSSNCTARGAGAGCSAQSDTTVSDRTPAAGGGAAGAVTGPVSVSNAGASVQCSGGAGDCGGTATSSTSARDTAVSPHSRGSSASADCTVTGGGCDAETSSSGSSAPDFVVVDPATGRPVAGQPTSGPTSTSSSSALLVCPSGVDCSGTVHTGSSAWDGAVAGGKLRTSTGTASCTAGTGGCDVQSVSNASTGSGAALALSGQPRSPQPQADGPMSRETAAPVAAERSQVNTARLTAGPSAASAAGATLSCEGQQACTGRVSSAATATDPAVSPDPRGSYSEGSCEGVSGGVCQAVTNSGASSGPDANVIAALVQARSTSNASVSSGTTGSADEQAPADDQPVQVPGQAQPATPPAPTAPGSSANSGGPTVPGASSWTMVSATLDCDGSAADCRGTAGSSASGSDGPSTLAGAGGARGPPEGVSTTAARCAGGPSACQAQTSSSAGSGQVVADIVAERQNSAAEQAGQQATEARRQAELAAQVAAEPGATTEQKKAATDAATVAEAAQKAAIDAAELAAKPVENAPATLSDSSAAALCAGASCTATTTGRTSGFPGVSRTEATCTSAASGCAVSSDAAASVVRSAGVAQGAKTSPGYSGSGQTSSMLTCPEAGCTGRMTGTADVSAGPQGRQSRSSAGGETGCDATTACQAQISAGTSATVGTDRDPAARFATTSASVVATCDNGTATGCATRTSSRTEAVGATNVRALATASCATAGGCRSATGGFAARDVAEVTASCAGTGCTTHTQGNARSAGGSAVHTTSSRTDCTAGPNGMCGGSSRVGASETGAEVSANCAGTVGSACSHRIAARSSAQSSTGNHQATADAGCGSGGGAGSGWCATSAAAQTSDGFAMAAAACQGSAGSGCRYSYRAHSSDSAGGATHATATGFGGGTFGAGQVLTTAAAAAGPGFAQASASCLGTAGTTCSHSYSAAVSASASAAGSSASASARGSGSGGMGGGGVAVSARAVAGPGYAQASASCTGTPGTSCSHSYSATAFASDSWKGPHGSHSEAEAYAHGSGGGGMGGGGVGVSAQAVAGPGFAQASASCSGAANCTTSFSAEAEMHARAEDPERGGYWEAWGHAKCVGGGSSGGTCGARAEAVPGPNGGGRGWCTGTGSCVEHSGGNSFDKYVQPGSGQPVDKNGKPIPIEELGPDDRAVQIERDADGNVVWKIKPKGENVRGGTCPAPCKNGVNESTEGGERVGYDPGDGFSGSMPTDPGSDERDSATGSDGVRLARDARGNGGGWVRGSGSVTNGRTGETVRYTRRATSDNPVNTFRLSDPAGSPFTSTCNGGCVYTGAKLPGKAGVDHLTVEGAWGEITGRDGNGNPARITFTGAGHFTSAEGDTFFGVAGTGTADRVEILTRNAAGLGGYIKVTDGYGTIRTAEGAELACTGCDGAEYMPTRAGMGGLATCSIGNAGDSCTATGAPWDGRRDVQRASIDVGATGAVEIAQFLRNADGSGGGAIAFTTGGGVARGTDADGNWIQ
ncbi:MAG TPA: hypothetical protein VGN22_10415, partial [Pseudonocardia sp.]